MTSLPWIRSLNHQTLWALQLPESAKQIEQLLNSQHMDERENNKRNALHCRVCQQHITWEDERTIAQGRHLHSFTNPYGVTFALGCFKRCEGCLPEGPASHEWTWFPGFSWQIQRCKGCGLHMGWRYQQDELCFFGLVLKQLIILSTDE